MAGSIHDYTGWEGSKYFWDATKIGFILGGQINNKILVDSYNTDNGYKKGKHGDTRIPVQGIFCNGDTLILVQGKSSNDHWSIVI